MYIYPAAVSSAYASLFSLRACMPRPASPSLSLRYLQNVIAKRPPGGLWSARRNRTQIPPRDRAALCVMCASRSARFTSFAGVFCRTFDEGLSVRSRAWQCGAYCSIFGGFFFASGCAWEEWRMIYILVLGARYSQCLIGKRLFVYTCSFGAARVYKLFRYYSSYGPGRFVELHFITSDCYFVRLVGTIAAPASWKRYGCVAEKLCFESTFVWEIEVDCFNDSFRVVGILLYSIYV